MATRKSTAGPAEIDPLPADPLESEIRRLQKLRAVLECLTFGLMYGDWEEVEDVNFADVASIALDLLSQSLTNLDSIKTNQRNEGQPV